jgi:hypothetical protein
MSEKSASRELMRRYPGLKYCTALRFIRESKEQAKEFKAKNPEKSWSCCMADAAAKKVLPEMLVVHDQIISEAETPDHAKAVAKVVAKKMSEDSIAENQAAAKMFSFAIPPMQPPEDVKFESPPCQLRADNGGQTLPKDGRPPIGTFRACGDQDGIHHVVQASASDATAKRTREMARMESFKALYGGSPTGRLKFMEPVNQYLGQKHIQEPVQLLSADYTQIELRLLRTFLSKEEEGSIEPEERRVLNSLRATEEVVKRLKEMGLDVKWKVPVACHKCGRPMRKFATGDEIPCDECDGQLCESCCGKEKGHGR